VERVHDVPGVADGDVTAGFVAGPNVETFGGHGCHSSHVIDVREAALG
jgi:hypothetical protein